MRIVKQNVIKKDHFPIIDKVSEPILHKTRIETKRIYKPESEEKGWTNFKKLYKSCYEKKVVIMLHSLWH